MCPTFKIVSYTKTRLHRLARVWLWWWWWWLPSDKNDTKFLNNSFQNSSFSFQNLFLFSKLRSKKCLPIFGSLRGEKTCHCNYVDYDAPLLLSVSGSIKIAVHAKAKFFIENYNSIKTTCWYFRLTFGLF